MLVNVNRPAGMNTATWATLPAAATCPGAVYLVTDVGGATMWRSNGTRWRPLNGSVVLSQACSPATGVASVTGTTNQQWLEIADISSGIMQQDDLITVHIQFQYTGSTNSKTISIAMGQNTGSLNFNIVSPRTTAGDIGQTIYYTFGAANSSTLMRQGSMINSMAGVLTNAFYPTVNLNLSPLKIYAGMLLTNASESMNIPFYSVTLHCAP